MQKNYKTIKKTTKKKKPKNNNNYSVCIPWVACAYDILFLISFYLYLDPFLQFNILTLILSLPHDEEVHALRRNCIYSRS